MQAAIGLSQLSKLDNFIQIRRNNFNYIYEQFKKFNCFDLPVWEAEAQPSWFGFPLKINNNAKFSRNELLRHYESNNIGTRLLFAGNILLQPAYHELNLKVPEDTPVADNVVKSAFWLGVYPGINKEMIDYVVDVTNEFISQKNRK